MIDPLHTNDPQHTSDHPRASDRIWRDAEALIERVEHAGRDPSSNFFEEAAAGLRLTSGALSVSLWTFDRDERSVMALSGVLIGDDVDADYVVSVDHRPRIQWTDDRLVVDQRIDDNLAIGLELRFEQSLPLARRQPTVELVEVILDLVSTTYLRRQLIQLRRTQASQVQRDSLIQRMSEGVGLADSFAAIASAIAADVTVDRVSLLRRHPAGYRLMSTSTQPRVDRRARQVRLLEQLANNSLQSAAQFTYCLGANENQDRELSDSLEAYLFESGCREVHLQQIIGTESNEPNAAIVLERFRGRSDNERPIESSLLSLQRALEVSVTTAISRDDVGWGSLLSRFSSPTVRRRCSVGAAAVALLCLVGSLVPTTLKIPVDGRVSSAKTSHLYAPWEGVVDEIFVTNGQAVRQGQQLLVLRSQDLLLEQRTIDGALATAQTRLASSLSRRSSGSATGAAMGAGGHDASRSATQQVLKKEIEGLEQQSLLIQQQIEVLTIRSPIDGKIDHWDLQHSLAARPVTQGQYLIDVISAADGWVIQLDVPDSSVNYVLNQQRQTSCQVAFRLRSDPTTLHHGEIERIASVAHLDAVGQSVVRATVRVDGSSQQFRSGASVLAQVHCGSRPIGFVLFRSLIQWWRSQSWF